MLHSVIPRKTPRRPPKRPHVVFAPDAATPLFVAEIPLLAAPCPPLASDLHQNSALFFGFDFGPRALDPHEEISMRCVRLHLRRSLGRP